MLSRFRRGGKGRARFYPGAKEVPPVVRVRDTSCQQADEESANPLGDWARRVNLGRLIPEICNL